MIRLTVFLLLLNFSLAYGQIATPPSQPKDTDLDSLSAGITGIVLGLGNGSGYQAATNSAVLTATTASFLAADETKLDGIESGATADQSDAEIETAYNNQVPAASQAEMEAGTETAIRRVSPLRVAQAIAALAAGSSFDIDALTQATEADIALTDKFAVSDGGTEKYILLSDMQDFWEAQTWTFSTLAVTTFQIGGTAITSTAAELNVLDGIPAGLTATELGYVDGVTSAIQTQLNAKQASDADLTAIAALAGTDNIYYRSAADTWSSVTIGSGLTFSAGTLSATGGGFDATALDNVTWSDGVNASNVWTFDLSGTDPTITFSSGAIAIGGSLTATDLIANTSATVPTASANDNDTSAASTAYVQTELTAYASDTVTFTNKTLDAEATGNVLKQKGYIYLIHPHLVQGTNTTLGTTSTAIGYGHATFSDSVSEETNYVEYYFQVPKDIDTSVALNGRLKIILGGTDTGTHSYVLSSVSVADSAVPTASTLANPIDVNFSSDAGGASGDVETSAWTTLTSWAGALTAGQTWRVRLARDGDDANDSSTSPSTEFGLVIEYGKIQ